MNEKTIEKFLCSQREANENINGEEDDMIININRVYNFENNSIYLSIKHIHVIRSSHYLILTLFKYVV